LTRTGYWTVLTNAFTVAFGNLGITLFIALVCGGPGSALAMQVSRWVLDAYPMSSRQGEMIAGQFIQMGVLIVWAGTVGAWAAAAALYMWVQREKQRPAGLYDAVNFGLNRFGRVWRPHMAAVASIAIGNIIIIPAILYALQYAFVDAIATLDGEEKDPRARSRRLTSGRRGTIFRTFFFFAIIWIVPYQVLVTFVLQDQGIGWAYLGGVVDQLVLVLIDLCMVQYYLDLFRKPAPAAAG
jgi:hypothetical protein